MFGENRFKLGIFAVNCSGGMTLTRVPERWKPTWENNLKLARMADESGIEFILPLARWKGYGGETNPRGETFETLTWAAGIAQATKNTTVFATAHTPLIHPLFAAKAFATIDHVSGGRFGLNIVNGWNQDEFDMFGVRQLEHDDRYAYGQEWFEIVQRLWKGDRFDYDGSFFKLKNVEGAPGTIQKPRPVTMGAGFSPAGRNFAARNCDFLFTTFVDLDRAKKDIADIRSRAEKVNRTLGVMTVLQIVCRETEKEARDYFEHYAVEMEDSAAVDKLMNTQKIHAQSFSPDVYRDHRQRFAGGDGVFPIIGTPQQVAETFVEISRAGFAGSTIAFVDFEHEFPFFRDRVIPLMVKAGLRRSDSNET